MLDKNKKGDNFIELDAGLGKIKDRSGLIVELTAFMDEMRHKPSVHKEHSIKDFVRLLVGEKYANKSPFKQKEGPLFYRNYSTAVFEKYSSNEEACSLFLAVNGLSPDYAELPPSKRIKRIAAQYSYSERTAYNHMDNYTSMICETLAEQICAFQRENLLILANEVFNQLTGFSDDKKGEAKRADNDAGINGNFIKKLLITSGWGDSGGGRRSYTASEVRYGKLGSQIVFNSVDGEYKPGDCKTIYPGDERDFVRVWRPHTNPKKASSWESEHIAVEDAMEYMIKLHIDNNNCWGRNAIAKDTKVALSIPSYSDTQISVRGYVVSSNATPSKYWDGVVFYSAENRPFHLKFKPDTAMIHNNSRDTNGTRISNDIATKATKGGALIGYDELNGEIPGGFFYQSEVTAWVIAVYDTYSVISTVRRAGTKEWSKTIEAEIGDQIEFQIEYNNTSTETQTSVMIRDTLPGNLKYVANTTKLYNSNYPNWATLTPDGDIVTRGVNIGSYLGSADGKGGGNAFVRFTAEVVDTDLACGENFIYNWGQAAVNGSLIENPSVVIVQKPE